jgi:hypothetical protein
MTNKNHLIPSLLGLAVVACGSANPRPESVTVTPEAVFELGEMTLFDQGQPVYRVHADGSTEMGYRSGTLHVEPGKPASTDSLPIQFKPGPTITAAGTISLGDKAVALQDDGTFVGRDGDREQQVPDVQLVGDRVTWATQSGAATMAISADGTVVVTGGNPDMKPALRVEGADTAGKRRVMLAILALTFTGKKAEGGSP